jgi:hypothetical protein
MKIEERFAHLLSQGLLIYIEKCNIYTVQPDSIFPQI